MLFYRFDRTTILPAGFPTPKGRGRSGRRSDNPSFPGGEPPVTYVITEACIGTKNTSCVDVCPVDCIHDGGDTFLIDPAECIDCAACVPVCPVNAIYPENEVPEALKPWIKKNRDFFARG